MKIVFFWTVDNTNTQLYYESIYKKMQDYVRHHRNNIWNHFSKLKMIYIANCTRLCSECIDKTEQNLKTETLLFHNNSFKLFKRHIYLHKYYKNLLFLCYGVVFMLGFMLAFCLNAGITKAWIRSLDCIKFAVTLIILLWW